MAAFTELDWSRIDVYAIVADGGLATIEEARHPACHDWLLRNGYAIDTWDCRPGLDVAIPELGRLLAWEEKFGYALCSDSRNLDALRDGFEFDIPDGGGRVFEIIGANRGWKHDRRWFCGLLAIAQEHSRRQLALGRRFFALVVVPNKESKLIGDVLEQKTVPTPFWSGCAEVRQFIR